MLLRHIPLCQSHNNILSAISTAILVLLRELENACEPAFNDLSRATWGALSFVSGHSAYVDELVKALEQVADVTRPLIEQKKYIRNFFDKAARCVEI